MASRRTAILEAATWLFSAKGYREASTTEVARLTGSAEGTVFYHFESKEKLFLAVLEEARKRIEQGFADFLPTTRDMSGLEALEAIAVFYLQLASDHEAQFMLLHRHQAYGLAEVNEECRVLLEAIYERFISAFEHAILRGQGDGSFGTLPAHKTAIMVYLMIDGLVRLKLFKLYDAGSLLEECLAGCRRLVLARKD